VTTSKTFEEFEHEGSRYLVIGYPAPRLSSFVDLSASELEVIEAWIGGQTMRAIAKLRGASTRTVANQIASAYRKVGVSSRGELLARLQKETLHHSTA
jgi:DNA-binding CsgD family transcriptional regulator